MSNQKQKAAKRKCNPPEGFVCETHDAAKDGVPVHLYHNPVTGEYQTEPLGGEEQ